MDQIFDLSILVPFVTPLLKNFQNYICTFFNVMVSTNESLVSKTFEALEKSNFFLLSLYDICTFGHGLP